MAQPFSLHCLGTPRLLAPNGRLVRLKTRKHLALLIYLAVEPRVQHRRDRLTTLLWEKAPSSDARHSLATAISMLRGKLGRESFESGRDWIRFTPTDLELDLDRLSRGEELPTDILPALDVGGFLEDLEVPDAPGFEHWRDGQRARWQPRIRDALVQLMDGCRRTGDFNQIERYADILLRIEELSEDGVRAKMEARAFAGDRLTALKIYETWKVRLAEELDASPAPLLEGIAVRLRHRGLERQNTSEIPPVPTDQWRDRPFVGRAAEYRTLYERWEASRDNDPRHVLVVGDSGVGKSTLLHRLATAAGLEGAIATRTQGHVLEQEVPYSALGTLMEDLIDRPGAACTEPAALAELARIVRKVGDRFPDLPEVTEAHGEAARFRLAESVERLLVNVAEEQPVILIVDDLHHTDDASIAVLHLLMRKLKSQRVMVLMAARTAELVDLPSARKLADGCEHVNLHVLELGPLSHAESEALLDTLVPSGDVAPTGTARQALLRAGAGFPMALELLTRDWLAHGEQGLALTLEAMTEDIGVAVPVHAYRQVFERIHDRLNPVTRNVLHLAGILGPRLNDPRMYAIADLSLGQTMTGLTRLTELRVLRDSGRELEFVNELIRSQAYLAVPSPLRRVLHERVAERLMAYEQEGREVPGLEIAWHLIRGGRGSEATTYLLRGARTAMLHGAPNEAERALSSGMDALKEPARSEAVILLAEALQEQGKLHDSLDLLAPGTMISDPSHRMKRAVLYAGGLDALDGPNRDNMSTEISHLLRIASSDTDPSTCARALRLVSTQIGSTPPSCVIDKFAACLARLQSIADTPDEHANIMFVKARLLYSSRDMSGSRDALNSAIAILRANGMTNSLLGASFNALGAVECAEGAYSDALTALLEAHRIVTKLTGSLQAPAVATNISLCLGMLGKYDEQEKWALLAIRLCKGLNRSDRALKAYYRLAFSQAMLGQHDLAIESIMKAERRYTAQNVDIQTWSMMKADIQYLCNEKAAALRSAAQVLPARPLPSDTAYAGSAARWLSHLLSSDMLSPSQRERGETTLKQLNDKSLYLDRLDRAEVCAALLMTSGDDVTQTHKIALIKHMQHLPSSAGTYLERLGMLGGEAATPWDT